MRDVGRCIEISRAKRSLRINRVRNQAARSTVLRGLAASGWYTAAITMQLLVESELKPAGGIIGAGFDAFSGLILCGMETNRPSPTPRQANFPATGVCVRRGSRLHDRQGSSTCSLSFGVQGFIVAAWSYLKCSGNMRRLNSGGQVRVMRR